MRDDTNLLIGRLEGKMEGLVEAMQKFAGEMAAMRLSFENLEKGRLSRLEIAFAESIAKRKADAVWIGVLSGGVVSIIVALILHYVFKV